MGDSNIFENVSYTIPTFTPQLGKRYRIALTLVMSAKVIGDESTGITPVVHWARGNLYLHTSGNFRFRVYGASHVYGTVSTSSPFTTSVAAGEFFNWKALTAESNTVVGTLTSQDPCALVYPTGRWKMPTAAEALILTRTARYYYTDGSTATVTNVVNSATFNRAARRLEVLYLGTDLPYDTVNRFTLLLFGYRSATSGNYTVTNFSTTTGNGYYWTSEQSSAANGTVLRIQEGASSSIRTEALSKTTGANVRCVRNLTWTESQIPALPASN